MFTYQFGGNYRTPATTIKSEISTQLNLDVDVGVDSGNFVEIISETELTEQNYTDIETLIKDY